MSPRAVGATAALLALAGCAAFSPDGGTGPVAALVQDRTGHAVAARSPADADAGSARAAELLAAPLAAEGAVELALLRNRALQASLATVGVAEADLVRAGRLRNPVFAFSRLALGGGALEIERSVVVDLLGLLAMPLERDRRRGDLEQAQLRAAADAVALAGEARRAWVDAVAAGEQLAQARRVADAADAASELAARMARVGNVSRLAHLRQHAFHADAAADLARAGTAALAARERLVRVLGLDGAEAAALALPERLPDLPGAPAAPADAERVALERRLDVAASRRAVATAASALGVRGAVGLAEGAAIGPSNRSETGAPRADGFALAVPIPLFDRGEVALRRADAEHRAAQHRAADLALRARSEAREAVAVQRAAWELARHRRDETVPLARRIGEENLLRYNGMLIGVFDLLADAREQARAVADAVAAARDFWLADADLRTALAGGSPAANPTPTAPPADAPRAARH